MHQQLSLRLRPEPTLFTTSPPILWAMKIKGRSWDRHQLHSISINLERRTRSHNLLEASLIEQFLKELFRMINNARCDDVAECIRIVAKCYDSKFICKRAPESPFKNPVTAVRVPPGASSAAIEAGTTTMLCTYLSGGDACNE